MDVKFNLKQLIIQNFATFRNQTIEFRTGLNSIVGETGSGKSLVLDALQLIFGARADKRIVRKDTEYALIEAVFHCHDISIKNFLEQEGYPIEGDEIYIKRLIYKNGTSKNYLNHLSCTLTLLSQFAKNFIDLVGQFENQKLLSESYQLKLLDQFGKLNPKIEKFKTIFHKHKELVKKKNEILTSQSAREQRLDYLQYQIQEIEKLNPSLYEEEELLKKKSLLLNYEKTQKLGNQIEILLEGQDSQIGILGQIKSLNYLLLKNTDLFKNGHEATSLIEDQLHQLQNELAKQLNFDIDQDELEGILEKLDLYQKVKKKFGGTVELVIQTFAEFQKEVENLTNIESNLSELDSQIRNLDKELQHQAKELHSERVIVAKKLSHELTLKVRNLRMRGATINLRVEQSDCMNEYGLTKLSFEAETNPGEGYFKIKDIASGGELSRILLSTRQILSSYDSISIFLFDEIDTGIGGETAIYIGKALEEVASNGQVIAITHLPQIAQFSETLIVVEKNIQENDDSSRTESVTKQLTGKNILREVKQMAHLQ